MKIIHYFYLLTALCFTQTLAAQAAWVQDSLDIFVTKAMETQQIPGMAFAVVQNGKVVLQRTYGVLEAGKPEKVDANTLFMIGSNTKAYTSTAIALLEKEGKLSLEDKATKWLPGLRLYDECSSSQVTVRDLLCHRLGTRTFQGDYTFWGSSLSREAVLEKMATLKPSYDFRTRFGYCNSAFLAAGQIIPAATGGQTWKAFIRERFFRPLKMDRALALSIELPTATNTAKPHALYDGRLQNLPWSDIDNLAPAASISLSISDMTHWLMMQLDTGRYEGKQVVPQDVVLKTWDANLIVNPRNGYSCGLGWFVDFSKGKKKIDHTGGVDGFLSATAFLPEQKLGVIVLTNTDNNSLYSSLRDQLLQVYQDDPYTNEIARATAGWEKGQENEAKRIADMRLDVERYKSLVSPKLDNFTGTYQNSVYGELKVGIEKGQLHVYPSHHPDSPGTLEYMGDNKFLCTFRNPTHGIHPMIFSMGEDGAVAGLTLKVNNFLEYGVYEFEKE